MLNLTCIHLGYESSFTPDCNKPHIGVGICRALYEGWTFENGECIKKEWGGCPPTERKDDENRFTSFNECMEYCGRPRARARAGKA